METERFNDHTQVSLEQMALLQVPVSRIAALLEISVEEAHQRLVQVKQDHVQALKMMGKERIYGLMAELLFRSQQRYSMHAVNAAANHDPATHLKAMRDEDKFQRELLVTAHEDAKAEAAQEHTEVLRSAEERGLQREALGVPRAGAVPVDLDEEEFEFGLIDNATRRGIPRG